MTTLVLRGAALLAIAIVAIACSGDASSSSSNTTAASTASPGALPSGFPIGTWTTTITPDDLQEAGLTDAGALAENVGTFTLEMAADGSWTTTQVSDVDVKWPVFRGTWVATGDDSFVQTTEFPADFAGDVVGFTWQRNGDNLLLDVPEPPDPVLPVIMGSHPWEPAE